MFVVSLFSGLSELWGLLGLLYQLAFSKLSSAFTKDDFLSHLAPIILYLSEMRVLTSVLH